MARLVKVLRTICGLIAALCSALFGSIDWYPPDWLRFAGHRVRAALAAARAQPVRAAGVLALMVALGVGAHSAWRWFESRPQPQLVTFEVRAPARTCYECDPPGTPNPLQVRFSASVAPLDAMDKPLDATRGGVTLTPAHAGQWRWDNDKTLVFTPSADWPVGQTFKVAFARKRLIAGHQRLDRDDFDFSSPAFTAEVKHTEFYQDPLIATDKKAVMTVAFSHPVDGADFERRIALKLYDKIADGKEQELGPVAHTVTYDKLRLEAYIASGQLQVPAKEGRLVLTVDDGVRAARGGNQTPAALSSTVRVPGINALVVQEFKLDLARDQNDDPQQVAVLEFNFPVPEQDTPPRLKAWLLPSKHPDPKQQARWEDANRGEPYGWSSGIDNRVLEVSQSLTLKALPGERDNRELHSFGYAAEPGRYVYLRLDKGLNAFGGYRLGETQERLLRVPEYPRELKVVAQGALLALSGPKLLNVISRDVPAMKVEVARLLPQQLQHLVTQTRGAFANPEWQNWSVNQDNLTEKFTRTERLPKLEPGKPAYTALDLAPYLKDGQEDRRGIFLLRLQAWDAEQNRAVLSEQTNEWGDHYDAPVVDTRLVVVTDLGILVKRNLDGSSDVFVQSIHSGQPVEAATVEIIGRNGLPVLERRSDADGHVRFPTLKDFVREQQPVLVLARKDGDASFLPLDRRIRDLDLSRFDVGGASNSADRNALSAYLFSDRGVYRPGEEIRIGAIVRTQDWSALPQGLPLQLEVTDPRGQRVRKERLPLSATGFEEIRHATQAHSATGTWTFSLSIMKNAYRSHLVGSVTVLVREFEPDRLKMTVGLSEQRAQGWVRPDPLKANVDLQNLFGAPAEHRRISATLRLSPQLPGFDAYPGYAFSDPQLAKEGFTEELADTQTDAQGRAEIDLRLQRFAKATYRLQLVAQGFEAEGGRGVAAEVTQLVSNMPFLVGVKPDGDLSYVGRNAQRSAQLVAIDPRLAKTEVSGLKLQRIEVRYVSALVKQGNGTFRYESRRREITLSEAPFAIPAAGQALALDTGTPGSFAYRVFDGEGQQLARLDYTVAGEANLSARLEKNAELQLVLSKKDYAPGEDIEMQINAPYTGAGLITIERDRVYAWKWFRSDTTASTQRIALPASGLEGNAYVSVSFVRDPGSPEIYTSPLSHGVAPFSIALDARRSRLDVQVPARVKPGEAAQFRYRAERPSKMLLLAVDEGILQVARWQTPDPLGQLFQKRSLDVGTSQILDLILPEFRAALMQAAPGGDADGLLAKHLNPFKRKTDAPVAFWSGIVDADATERTLSYTVPDHFNGRLRVVAVAVSDQAVGVYEGGTLVRADFILSPNAPAFVAPGDTFEVSLGVSNQAEGSGAGAGLALKLETGAGLEVIEGAGQTLAVAEGREGSARFKLKATDTLGDARLTFTSTLGDKRAQRSIGVSVRPATPYRTQIEAAVVKPGATLDTAVPRALHPQFREQEAGISSLPMGLAGGFIAYLGHYPYSCTEQLVSQAMPALVLAQRPAFGRINATPSHDFAGMIAELRARQNPDGAYRYWPGSFETHEFVSVYVQHVLLEASERQQAVPRDLLDAGNAYLRGLAARDADSLEQERNGAYALYLLTRQGETLGAEASRLRERLESRYAKQWRGDIASAYLAASMKLMKQDREADALFARIELDGERAADRWHDAMTADAELLYLAARHFPARLDVLPPRLIDTLAARITQHRYHSLSAATTLLALDAYANVAAAQAAGQLKVSELRGNGALKALPLPDGLFPKTDLAEGTAKLRFQNLSAQPAYTFVRQAGFDRAAPAGTLREGFEILREYTDTQGRPVTRVRQGDEILARLKFRSISGASSGSVALVDLLPGGFELVVPPTETRTQLGRASTGEALDTPAEDGEAEETGDPVAHWTCPVCQPGTRASLSYADFRDDRSVFYVGVTPGVSEIVYRLKATNSGTYTIPPAYGEGLYEREFNARSTPGSITVTPP